jgi:hypothetical protein
MDAFPDFAAVGDCGVFEGGEELLCFGLEG